MPVATITTAGPDAALDLVLRSLFEPGVHRVAVTPPATDRLEAGAARHGLYRYRVPLTGPRVDRLDVPQLLRLPVKGILLADPVDAAGTVRLAAEDLDRLLALFPGPVVLATPDRTRPPRPNLLLIHRATVHAPPSLLRAPS